MKRMSEVFIKNPHLDSLMQRRYTPNKLSNLSRYHFVCRMKCVDFGAAVQMRPVAPAVRLDGLLMIALKPDAAV